MAWYERAASFRPWLRYPVLILVIPFLTPVIVGGLLFLALAIPASLHFLDPDRTWNDAVQVALMLGVLPWLLSVLAVLDRMAHDATRSGPLRRWWVRWRWKGDEAAAEAQEREQRRFAERERLQRRRRYREQGLKGSRMTSFGVFAGVYTSAAAVVVADFVMELADLYIAGFERPRCRLIPSRSRPARRLLAAWACALWARGYACAS